MGEARDRLATSLAFAITEAVESGAMDEFLAPIALAVQRRNAIFDQRKPPPRTPEMTANGQVWVWMNHDAPERSRWEIRGTGARWDPAWGERKVVEVDDDTMRELGLT